MRNQIFLIIFTITHYLIHNGYAQTGDCGPRKFECKSGECIRNELLCDGLANCEDGSDETYAECNKPEVVCSKYAFRCSYGACVDGDATCNGVRDCIDNSDETLSRCASPVLNATLSCTRHQFKCDNGQCIAQSGLCDGITDCADKSDETFIRCGSLDCPEYSFRCLYGACINGDLKCNGVKNCADGSDEDSRQCNKIPPVTNAPPTPSRRPVTTSTTKVPPTVAPPTSSSISCIVPPQPNNGVRKLHKSQCCDSNNNLKQCDHCDVNEGTLLRSGSYLVYECNNGYNLTSTDAVFCGPNGEWLNVPACTEIQCTSLELVSRTATCTFNGRPVECNKKPSKPGTEAVINCSFGYEEPKTFLSKSKVLCNENGKWEPKPKDCVAVCGHSIANLRPLIVHGQQPKTGEFPWHATLYITNSTTESKSFICGATLISDKLLITAAHCVYNEGKKDEAYDPTNFHVLSGNIFKDYDGPHDSTVVQKREVKKIFIHCKYYGASRNYASDIAILEVKKPFVPSAFLMPICLDRKDDTHALQVGNLGKVAGFGRTAYGQYSSILQSLTVPYVLLKECESASQRFGTVKYITTDKFCAGYTNGSSVCDGDSGGGLAFYEGELWYLRGIVSTSLGVSTEGGSTVCDSNTYSLYTRVYHYIGWIEDVIQNVESNIRLPECI